MKGSSVPWVHFPISQPAVPDESCVLRGSSYQLQEIDVSPERASSVLFYCQAVLVVTDTLLPLPAYLGGDATALPIPS